MANIFTESFETDANGTRYTTSIPEFSDGSNDFFTRTDGSNISGGYNVTGADSNFYFATQDIDGEGANSQQTLSFSGIDISNFTNLNVSALFAEDDSSDGEEDWDLPDSVKLEYQIDNGGFQNLLAIESIPDGDNFNAVPALDTDFDGNGDGTQVTDSFQPFSNGIAGTGSLLDLRFTFNLDSGDEDIAIDQIQVTGDDSSGNGETTLAIAPNNATQAEGDSGTIPFIFTVTRSGDTSSTTDVNFTVSSNQADASDFGGTLPAGTVNFAANETSQEITVDVAGDTDVESNENFTVTLSNPTGASITTASATGTIQNDDASATPNLIINEILADPASGSDGDANGDGTRDFAEDEFVELVNNSGTEVDLANWELSDDDGAGFTFPSNTVLAAGQAAVVFGGGNPTGDFGGALIFTADGSIGTGLANSGDQVILTDNNGNQMATQSYGGEGGDDQSLTRDPDLTGSFVQHSQATGSGGALFSPGTQIDGTPFTSQLPVINEFRISSSNNDSTNNFLEVATTPDTSLNNFTVVKLSGEFEPGQIDRIIDLSDLTTDSDGVGLIADDGTSATLDMGDKTLTDLDFFGSPASFFIVEGFDSSSVSEGDDLDSNNDGTLDNTPWDRIVDQVALTNGTANGEDINYANNVQGPDGDFPPAGLARIPDRTGSFTTLAFNDTSVDTPGELNEGDMTGETQLEIFEIQGNGNNFTSPAYESPVLGQQVTTQGIVTAIANNGFYIQNKNGDGNINTSDGIFVFTNNSPSVSQGDEVDVSGTVGEDFQDTRIESVTDVSVLSSNNTIQPIVLGSDRVPPTEIVDDAGSTDYDVTRDGRDFYESLEGMLVTLPDAVATSLTQTFGSGSDVDGEFYALANQGSGATGTNARGGITISEETSSNNPIGADLNPERIQIDNDLATGSFPNVNVGDQVGDITGVIDFSFNDYSIRPRSEVNVTTPASLPRETTNLVGNQDQLTLATFNVENLDPNDNDGDTDIVDGKFTDIATQITDNLQSPDIITLQEVQDNSGSADDGTVSADQTLQTLVDEISAAGGPQYSFQDNTFITDGASGGQPGGNIRVAFLYRDDRVDLVSDSVQPIGDQNTGSPFNGARLPLAGDFTFNGETITVVGNHFSSKGGSDPLFGDIQPPANGSLDERNAQAAAVNDFISQQLNNNPDANIATLGDFNEFQFFSPLETLEQNLTNLTETLPETERYTFNFEGNAQALDHTLISQSLVDNANPEYDIVHVNSEFADQASDHDPAVARLTFPRPEEGKTIQGTFRSESLEGSAGNDTIIGLTGQDTLTGGEGTDNFVYQRFLDFGDVITDFEPSNDVIDLSKAIDRFPVSLFNSENPFQDYVNLEASTESGTTVQFDVFGDFFFDLFRDVATLENVAPNDLSASDFQF